MINIITLIIMKNKINSKQILKIFLVFIMLVIIITIEYILITTSVEKTIDNIKIPDIFVETKFEKLTEKGLEFSVRVNIFNPNNFELKIDEFSLIAKTDENKKVCRLSIEGGIIKPGISSAFKSKGVIVFEAFDAKVLTFSINGDAMVKFGDYDKTLTFSTNMDVLIPKIADFVFQNETVNIELPVQFKIRLRGLLAIVGFKVFNPSKIPIIGKNLVCRIYRLDGDIKTLLVEQDMNPCEITSKPDVSVETEILISYPKFFFSGGFKLLPDWIILQIDGDLLIAGTRQVLPFSINADVDPHMIRTLDKR